MKTRPIFLDFFNREACRATHRDRTDSQDLEIIRTLAVCLPYGFSANISQLAEYGNARPQLFSEIIKLIEGNVIDATSVNATPDEFISERQRRYHHVQHRYPFYFKDVKFLEDLKLGSRNEFSMTDDLSRLITNYRPDQFDFDLARASASDRSLFESGHKATVRKILDREELAITRDLLETNRGGADLTALEIEATTRVISALYMKNYADRRGLATCTGIPAFPYREMAGDFPNYDFPILRRSLIALGGAPYLFNIPISEIIESYGTIEHSHFAFYLAAFLDSAAAVVRAQSNNQTDLSSLRTLFVPFFVRELDISAPPQYRGIPDFFMRGTERITACGQRVAMSNTAFSQVWSKHVPAPTVGLIAITTATESEDRALFAALADSGFNRSRLLRLGDGVVQEWLRGINQRIVHLRTSPGSLGVNSAGMVLPEALRELDVRYLVSAGICFGLKPTKDGKPYQKYGDVLIANGIQDYETQRVGDIKVQRGERLPASNGLLAAARIARDRIVQSDYKVYEGLFVSGQKLVDKEALVEELRGIFPDAIGGEMEGNAIAAASVFKGRQWILIKGICDWGFDKRDKWQEVAAKNACRLAVSTILNVLDAE